MSEAVRIRAGTRLVVARTVHADRCDGVWMVTDARTGARLPAAPIVEACLDACAEPITRPALMARLQTWPAPIAEQMVVVLEAAGFLVDAGTQQAESWAPWAPVAEWFHQTTRDVPVRKGAGPQSRPPSPVRRRRGDLTIALPLPSLGDRSLARALATRRTWRQFATTPLTLADLGTLLGTAFGVQAWADTPIAGRSALKTSPSGGARHSLEAYVAVRRVQGVTAGLYHYRPDRHALVRLADGCAARDIGRFLPGQPGYRRAAVTCFLSSELARVRWRYPNARAYRVVMIEAGHLAQTFSLVAAALGLAAFTTGALADTVIEDAFGLSASSSPVVYACGAGARPAGVEWAPYADRPAPTQRATRLGRHDAGGQTR